MHSKHHNHSYSHRIGSESSLPPHQRTMDEQPTARRTSSLDGSGKSSPASQPASNRSVRARLATKVARNWHQLQRPLVHRPFQRILPQKLARKHPVCTCFPTRFYGAPIPWCSTAAMCNFVRQERFQFHCRYTPHNHIAHTAGASIQEIFPW